MTGPAGAAAAGAEGRLARVHLRTGMLRLARVELEELAGKGTLDDGGVLDLAEARWRTGDLRGAAEAARVWLDGAAAKVAHGDPAADPPGAEAGGRARALAHAVTAEALTIRGRNDDAAVHVAAALDALRGSGDGRPGSEVMALGALFAGIPPRADAWPPFEPLDPDPDLAVETDADARPARLFVPSGDPAAPGMGGVVGTRPAPTDDAAAAVLLLLALRATPGGAGEILERANAALTAGPSAAFLLVRAEALSALGRHDEAAIAYAVAASHARSGASQPAGRPAVSPADAPATARDAATTPDPERSSE